MRNVLTILTAIVAVAVFFPSSVAAQTPEEELEKKLAEIDITDPDQLFEVAKWAAGNSKSSKVRKDGRKLVAEVLDLDEDHEEARKFLGYVQFDGKWLKKKDYEKAMRKAREAEMKEKGYIFFKGGWIKRDDRKQWNNKWEKSSDDVWMSYEDVMRAKGYTFYEGAWLQLTDDDRQSMEYHRKMTGDDILVTTTPHFVLHIDRSAKWAEMYTKKAEEVYEWYTREFKVAGGPTGMMLPRKAHIWTFETTQQYQDWITTYSERYEFTDEDKEYMRERPGGRLLGGKCIITLVAKKAEDLENPLIHQISTLCMWYHTRRSPSFMDEAFGHLAEHLLSSEKNGRVNCSTRSKYAGDGGVAQKEFTTKDGRPRCKSVVKAGDDRPLLELSMIGLNSLNGDDLAQGFSIIEWLYNHRREDMANWLNHFRKVKISADIAGSAEKVLTKYMTDTIEATLAESVAAFEADWRKYVKKEYR